MAVYTALSDEQLAHIIGIYEGVGAFRAASGIDAGSINTMYKVETDQQTVYLRIAENKTMADLVYERDLLTRLHRAAPVLGGVKAPRILSNVIGGHFFPIDGPPPKKYAMVFEQLDGRELAIFELGEEHLVQVGAFLARAHRVLRPFKGGRANPYGLGVLARWLEGLRHHDGVDPHLTARAHRSLMRIARARAPLPRGVVHGDLFLNNTKWRRGRLDAVFDWEMAGRDHLMLDVGIALCAWCWARATPGQPAGFRGDLCYALLDGYQSVRRLRPSERRGLFHEVRLAALRFMLSRVRDFEVAPDDAPSSTVTRDYLDYRDYLARLDAIEAMGPRGFRRLVGLHERSPTT